MCPGDGKLTRRQVRNLLRTGCTYSGLLCNTGSFMPGPLSRSRRAPSGQLGIKCTGAMHTERPVVYPRRSHFPGGALRGQPSEQTYSQATAPEYARSTPVSDSPSSTTSSTQATPQSVLLRANSGSYQRLVVETDFLREPSDVRGSRGGNGPPRGRGGRCGRIMRGFHHSKETLKSMSFARHKLLQKERRQVGRLEKRALAPWSAEQRWSAARARDARLHALGGAVNAPVCAASSKATTLRHRAVLSHVTSQAEGLAGLISPRWAPY